MKFTYSVGWRAGRFWWSPDLYTLFLNYKDTKCFCLGDGEDEQLLGELGDRLCDFLNKEKQ